MSLVKSKQRVAAHGEVFTPAWLVEAMLDLVKGETERISPRPSPAMMATSGSSASNTPGMVTSANTVGAPDPFSTVGKHWKATHMRLVTPTISTLGSPKIVNLSKCSDSARKLRPHAEAKTN